MMAPDDIPFEHPASETQRTPTGRVDSPRRSVGPESEVRGGPEALDGAPDTNPPVGTARENDPSAKACRDPARNDRDLAGRANASDPPKPPGTPPEVPDPDQPPPIEEPPPPIPIPPNDPPPPIVAASRRPASP
jgi:hypothetical protein